MFERLRVWWSYQQGMMFRFWGHRTVRREFYLSAVAAFSRVLEAQPDHVEACLARGLLYWRELQDGPAAVRDFTTVLRCDPSRVEALFYRGMAYQLLGDYALAIGDLQAAIERAPGAFWRHNAYRQMVALQAILDDLPDQLEEGDRSLLGSGTNQPSTN